MGDAKYGDFEWNKAIKKKYHLNSQLLHAYSLNFVRPIGSMKYMQGKTITAHLPPLFKKIKKDLFD
jgi:23S rRNA pseudouridine955/2504/2580 synthase